MFVLKSSFLIKFYYPRYAGFCDLRRGSSCKVLNNNNKQCIATDRYRRKVNCVFPFTFEGQRFTSCTTVGENWKRGRSGSYKRKWCSTKTDRNGQHQGGRGQYGYCSDGCPGGSTFRRTTSLLSLRGGEEDDYDYGDIEEVDPEEEIELEDEFHVWTDADEEEYGEE